MRVIIRRLFPPPWRVREGGGCSMNRSTRPPVRPRRINLPLKGGGNNTTVSPFFIRRLGEKPLEAARQYFPHHGKVVPRREFGGANVEFAILIFVEAFRTGDDHGADGVGSLDMAGVIKLDAPRYFREHGRVREPAQQVLLRRGLGPP